MPETSCPVGMSAAGGAFGSRLGPRPGSLGGLEEGGGSAGVVGGGVVPAGGSAPEPDGGVPLLSPPGLTPDPPELPELDPPELPPLFLGGFAFFRGRNSNVSLPTDSLSPSTVSWTMKDSRVL